MGSYQKQYSENDMKAAIYDVHMGMSVYLASCRHHVPRRTLSYRVKRCKEGHVGKCQGAYKRTETETLAVIAQHHPSQP